MLKFKASIIDGMQRNKKVDERISEEMAARGFVRSFKQCRNKAVSANAIRLSFLRQECPASFRAHVQQTNRTCDRPMLRSNTDA